MQRTWSAVLPPAPAQQPLVEMTVYRNLPQSLNPGECGLTLPLPLFTEKASVGHHQRSVRGVSLQWPFGLERNFVFKAVSTLLILIMPFFYSLHPSASRWSLGNHENFALQIADATNFYITEKVR